MGVAMDENLHKDHRKRVRRRYIDHGLDAFDDHQVLELLLYYAIPRRDTNELAHRLINEFGSLHDLFEAKPSEIAKRCDVSENVAVLVSLIPPVSRRYLSSKTKSITAIKSTKTAGELAISLFLGKTTESLYIICLNKHQGLIKAECVTQGNSGQAPIYPEEIAKAALRNNAEFVILTHNHPGGVLEPSKEDIIATKKIMKSLSAVGIMVLDHIIVSQDKFFSFTEKKVMPNNV